MAKVTTIGGILGDTVSLMAYTLLKAAACTTVALCVSVAAGTSGRAAVIMDSLVIRIYDNAGVLQGQRARAMKAADQILSNADLHAEWLDCPAGVSGVAAEACHAPPGPHELIIRVTRAPREPHLTNRQDLGYSLVDARTGIGRFGTVFMDRVDTMARQSNTDPSTILGRAVAHEIGHLVLGTNGHANAGLMRQVWTVSEVLRNRAEDWLFAPQQRPGLREGWLAAATRMPRPRSEPAATKPRS